MKGQCGAFFSFLLSNKTNETELTKDASLPDQQHASPKREILSIAYTELFDRVLFMILYHVCFQYLVGQDWVFLSRVRWG